MKGNGREGENKPNRVIAIGASAGGVEALQYIAAELPAGLDAAVLVVLHLRAETPSLLDRILQRRSRLPVVLPHDNTPIERGHIYVARPDFHLVVEDGHLCLSRGPRENRHRPAVDVLFRSLAAACGVSAVGVVLTGFLDDGAAGLVEIKNAGGVAVVQDPDDAVAPDMPRNALEQVEADHIVPLTEIPQVIQRLAEQPAHRRLDKKMPRKTETSPKDGSFSCPECGGPVEELEIQRFRCRVGHTYSLESLAADNEDAVERALWAALQSLEQSAVLNQRLAERARARGRDTVVAHYARLAEEKRKHAGMLRRLITAEHAAERAG